MTDSTSPTVWVLHLHHRHGDDYSAHTTEESAQKTLQAYVGQWWTEDGPTDQDLPDDPAVAIAEYFENSDDEWYGLVKTVVQS